MNKGRCKEMSYVQKHKERVVTSYTKTKQGIEKERKGERGGGRNGAGKKRNSSIRKWDGHIERLTRNPVGELSASF